ERRLLYVGITRAQEELYLVHAESRLTFGRTEPTRPSRFLEDVPREHVVETDVFGQELTGPQAHSKFARDVWRPPTAAQPSARTEITVVFESAGAKRLLLKYASLARA